MSLVQPSQPPERRPPPPPPQFGSNNPFRNRASQLPPMSSGPADNKPRPQSKNPFLDVFDDEEDLLEPPSRQAYKSNSFSAASSQRPQLTGAAAELFENLTITDHDRELKSQLNQNSGRDAARPDGQPGQSHFKGRPPPALPPGHRHSKSSDSRTPNHGKTANPFPSDRERAKHPPPPTIRQPPREPPRQRQRRNSDSSVMDAHEMERERVKERERRERKPRETSREPGRTRGESTSVSREKDSGRRPSKTGTGLKGRKGMPLDVIDKLDVTGIYGSGLFHHDGPFDACNPHRNKNTSRAPMHAFPADSANNALTGFGPLPEKGDHSRIFGAGDEAYSDYNMTACRRGSSDDSMRKPNALRTTSFDPVTRVEPVHGDETLGLGSSTFLDGAPASRKAILQQITETQQVEQGKQSNEGLGRKKSLSHKIRGIAAGRPRYNPDGRRRGSDEAANMDTRGSPPTPTIGRKKGNDPFGDYDSAYDRKSENINSENDRRRDRTPSSPKRAPIGGGSPPSGNGAGSGSLLKRVRSLSKPKRRE